MDNIIQDFCENSIKKLFTVFGEVKYQRTYYRSKSTGKHKYLSDEFLGINSHDRIDMSLKARLIDKAVDTAYGRSGKKLLNLLNYLLKQ